MPKLITTVDSTTNFDSYFVNANGTIKQIAKTDVDVGTDTTLSVSGKAADAKTVGDEITELTNKIPNILTANVFSTSVLRCTKIGKPVERDLSSVDLSKVNAIGAQVTIPGIGSHFCFIPKVNVTTAPRSTFSCISAENSFVSGYAEVDWTNKKISFCVQFIEGWTIANVYLSAIYFFQ